MDIVKYETEAICIFLIFTYTVEGPAFRKTMDFPTSEFGNGLFGVLDLGNEMVFRYAFLGLEMVPDVRMMETIRFRTFGIMEIKRTGSGRLDNGNRNEPECRTKLRPDFGSTASPPGRDFEVYFPVALLDGRISKVLGYRFNILKVKGTEKTKEKGEDERGKGKGKEKGKPKWRRGNISKVQWLLGHTGVQYFEGLVVLVLKRMEFNISKVLPASTSASDI
ncbi:unnamed protein product [Rhizophagus irregularis]|nr:unnamed protein product [Rhizophagus irregularis]